MKNIIVLLIICISLAACNAQKKGVGNKKIMTTEKNLDGTWELVYLSGQNFDKLYEKRRPFLKIDIGEKKMSGNTSCNSYFGGFEVNGKSISFPEPIGMTKMFCEGRGEENYMTKLRAVKDYSIDENGSMLSLTDGSETLLRFTRK